MENKNILLIFTIFLLSYPSINFGSSTEVSNKPSNSFFSCFIAALSCDCFKICCDRNYCCLVDGCSKNTCSKKDCSNSYCLTNCCPKNCCLEDCCDENESSSPQTGNNSIRWAIEQNGLFTIAQSMPNE